MYSRDCGAIPAVRATADLIAHSNLEWAGTAQTCAAPVEKGLHRAGTGYPLVCATARENPLPVTP